MDFTTNFFNLLLDFGDEWVITNIDTNHKTHEIFLNVEYVSESYEDPVSHTPAKLYDHTETRVWRHLDILHYKSYISCRIPRVLCADGKVRQISIGWANKHDRHTFSFEIKVIDLLKATKNQSKTAEYLNCSFRLVNRIMHRCTQRGMDRRNYSNIPFEHISIDEKSFQKGHKYVTVISHPKSGVIMEVGENRDTASTEELLEKTFTPNQLKSIQTVSMDMWKPYMQSIEVMAPNAEIVHDRFHLVKYLNDDLN
jgi:transposase